jgi:hypothetical protein
MADIEMTDTAQKVIDVLSEQDVSRWVPTLIIAQEIAKVRYCEWYTESLRTETATGYSPDNPMFNESVPKFTE